MPCTSVQISLSKIRRKFTNQNTFSNIGRGVNIILGSEAVIFVFHLIKFHNKHYCTKETSLMKNICGILSQKLQNSRILYIMHFRVKCARVWLPGLNHSSISLLA